MQKTCPVCAAPGDDLVFTFECTNPDCQNFVIRSQERDAPESDDNDTETDPYSTDWAVWSD